MNVYLSARALGCVHDPQHYVQCFQRFLPDFPLLQQSEKLHDEFSINAEVLQPSAGFL